MALSKIPITVKNSKPWLRVAVASDDVICKGLLAIFHKDEQFYHEPMPHIGFDRNPKTLYKQLKQPVIYNKLLTLFKKKIIKQDQWDLLFPANMETHSIKFDITLLGVLIKNLNGIKTLNGKWKREQLDVNDKTLLGFVIKALVFRNLLYHFGSITAMTPAEETTFWSDLTLIAKGLRYQSNVHEYQTTSLDPDSQPIIDTYTTWFKTQIDIINDRIADLAKCQDQDQTTFQNIEQEVEELRVMLHECDSKTEEQCLEVFNEINESMVDIITRTDNLEIQVNTITQAVRANKEKTEKMEEDIEIIKGTIHKRSCTEEENDFIPDDFVVLKVLEIVAEKIEKDWRRLSSMLGANQTQSIFDKLFKKQKELVMQAFNSLNYKVSWQKLRRCLVELRRNDVIELIEKETSITQGDYHFNAVLTRYKKQITDEFQAWNQKEPIRTVDGRTLKTAGRMDLYDELVVGEWEIPHNFDLEHFQQRNLTNATKLQRDDIITLSDRCVLVRGIAGIGKTSLLNTLLYNWSLTNCLKDFELVVKIECRKLNVMQHLNSWKDILCRQHPNLFDKTVLNHMAEKNVLILIDGIDEYEYFNELKTIMNENKLGDSPANALYDLLLTVQPCWHVLICGRPTACEEIVRSLDNLYSKCKRVEITGFNQEGLTEYIEKFNFTVDSSTISLQLTLEENLSLKSFMCIPAYAYTICSIYDQEETLLEQLNTPTKLNLALFLVHLRDFMKKSNSSLIELCKDPEIIGVVHDLAKFAYKSLDEGRIIFEEEEMYQCKYLTEIEKTGIFVKCVYGENGIVYQFRHLILQELLCAIHIYRTIDIKLIINNFKMKNALLMFIGLLGCHQNVKCPKYLSSFVLELQTEIYDDDESKCSALIRILKNYIYSVNDNNSILPIMFEYHKETSPMVNNFLENKDVQFELYNKFAMFKVLYFIKYFKAEKVTLRIGREALTIQQATELVKVVEFARGDQFLNCNKNRSIIKTSQKASLKSIDLFYFFSGLQCGVLSALSPILPWIEEFKFMDYSIDRKDWRCFIDSVISSDAVRELNLKKILAILFCDDGLVGLSQIAPFIETLLVGSSNGEEDCEEIIDKGGEDNEKQLEEDAEYKNGIFTNGWKSLKKCVLESHHNGALKLRKLTIFSFRVDNECCESLSSIFPLLGKIVLSHIVFLECHGLESITQSVIKAQSNGKLKLKDLCLEHCYLRDDFSIVPVLSPIFPLLEKVVISNDSQITEDGLELVTQGIINSHNNGVLKLIELKLKTMYLHDACITMLSSIVPLFQKFSFAHVKSISTDGWKSFAQKFMKAHNEEVLKLTRLSLYNCDLNDDSIVVLSSIFPLLQSVDLGDNKDITKDGWKSVTEHFMKAHDKEVLILNLLRLDRCGLNDDSIVVLSSIFPLLQSVYLSSNKHITQNGWESVARAIVNSYGKEELQLSNLVHFGCKLNDDSEFYLESISPMLIISGDKYMDGIEIE